jgi:hypothetical protein
MLVVPFIHRNFPMTLTMGGRAAFSSLVPLRGQQRRKTKRRASYCAFHHIHTNSFDCINESVREGALPLFLQLQ